MLILAGHWCIVGQTDNIGGIDIVCWRICGRPNEQRIRSSYFCQTLTEISKVITDLYQIILSCWIFLERAHRPKILSQLCFFSSYSRDDGSQYSVNLWQLLVIFFHCNNEGDVSKLSRNIALSKKIYSITCDDSIYCRDLPPLVAMKYHHCYICIYWIITNNRIKFIGQCNVCRHL